MVMVIKKTCKYKKDKDKDNKYKMTGGSGTMPGKDRMPGKWTQKAYSATTFSQKTKAQLIKGVKYGSIVYYPLRRLVKVLTSLPRRAWHSRNKPTSQIKGKDKLTYKEAYGLKNRSHVKSALKAIE